MMIYQDAGSREFATTLLVVIVFCPIWLLVIKVLTVFNLYAGEVGAVGVVVNFSGYLVVTVSQFFVKVRFRKLVQEKRLYTIDENREVVIDVKLRKMMAFNYNIMPILAGVVSMGFMGFDFLYQGQVLYIGQELYITGKEIIAIVVIGVSSFITYKSMAFFARQATMIAITQKLP